MGVVFGGMGVMLGGMGAMLGGIGVMLGGMGGSDVWRNGWEWCLEEWE